MYNPYKYDTNVLRCFIKAGIHVDKRCELWGNITPLMLAVADDNIYAARVLIEAEANVNLKDNRGSLFEGHDTPVIECMCRDQC
jgi:ankyrin repeat protein